MKRMQEIQKSAKPAAAAPLVRSAAPKPRAAVKHNLAVKKKPAPVSAAHVPPTPVSSNPAGEAGATTASAAPAATGSGALGLGYDSSDSEV
jgi:hypothetical protein